jgi:phage shock protein C
MATNKRLYKIEEEGKIMGVCAGLADYFDMDPSVVRLIAVLLLIFGNGATFIIYIVLGIILPEKNEVY